MDEAPDWLEQWNRRRMADSRAGTVWTRLIDDESQYRRYAGLDAVVGEWTAEDTVFPHRIPGTPPDPVFYKYVRRTPFADEMTLSVALSAMVAHDIGEDQFTDILAVSFSGTDLVGHEFGPDSQGSHGSAPAIGPTARRVAGKDRQAHRSGPDYGRIEFRPRCATAGGSSRGTRTRGAAFDSTGAAGCSRGGHARTPPECSRGDFGNGGFGGLPRRRSDRGTRSGPGLDRGNDHRRSGSDRPGCGRLHPRADGRRHAPPTTRSWICTVTRSFRPGVLI